MVFFPASLRHSVYPFFTLPGEEDGCRVSIAGNLWYDAVGTGMDGNPNNRKAKERLEEKYDYEKDFAKDYGDTLTNPFSNKIDIKKKSKSKSKRKGFGNL